MTDLSTVRYEVSDGIARITLARPDSANAFDQPTAELFASQVRAAGLDPEVRVILIDAEGTRFCAGGDVAAMAAAPDQSAYLLRLAETLDDALQIVDSLEKPVIAQAHGVVAGAGLALLLAADIVVSARSTRFLAAYAGVGLTPDCGLSWLLPRAVGQQRALDLLLTGRILSAEEAQGWGMVTRVVDDAELAIETSAIATRLASGSPFALGQARRLVRSSWLTTRASAGQDEARTIARAVATPEAGRLLSEFAAR